MKNKLIIKLLRATRAPSRARISKGMREYNKAGISSNWQSQGANGFNGRLSS